MAHLILTESKENRIVSFEYFESKFERKIGDRIVLDGIQMKVAIIAETQALAISEAQETIKVEARKPTAPKKLIGFDLWKQANRPNVIRWA